MASIRTLLNAGNDFDDRAKATAAQHESAGPLKDKARELRKTIASYKKKLAGCEHVLASKWARYTITFVVFALGAFFGDVAAIAWTAQLTSPETPLAVRIFWATVVATVASLFFHFGWHLLFQDRDRTSWTVRWHLWFAIPSLGVSLACFTLLRMVPFLPPAVIEVLSKISWVIPIVLNVALPIAAGSFSSLAEYFVVPKRYLRRLLKAEEQLELVVSRLAVVASVTVPTPEPTSPPAVDAPVPEVVAQEPRDGGNGSSRDPLRVLPLIGILMLTPFVTRCTSVPEATIAGEPAVVPVEESEGEQVEELVQCRVDVDATATVSRTGRKDGTRAVVEHLPAWLSLYGCTELAIALFGNDGAWNLELQRFAVPRVPQPDCREGSEFVAQAVVAEPAASEEPPRTFQDLLTRDLRPERTVLQSDASMEETTLDQAELCEPTVKDLEQYAQDLEQLQHNVYQALMVSDNEIVTTGVTDVAGVLVSQNFGVTRAGIVLTDALHNASEEIPSITLRKDYHPELVVIPTEPGHTWATAAKVQKRLSAFQAAMPGLTIRYYNTISADTWRRP